MPLNTPRYWIVIGLTGSTICGSGMPFLGWFMAEIIGCLTGPMDWFGGPEGVEKKITQFCTYILFIAIAEMLAW